MKLKIPRDMFDNTRPPRLFLCTTRKQKIQELPAYSTELAGKWGAYGELSFNIDKQYIDVLTGEVNTHPTFDKAEGLRGVLVEDIGYFLIQDPNSSYSDKDSKSLNCFSSEYACASKFLVDFRVNTGDVDSIEITYLSSIYGENYTIDSPYTEAMTGQYSAFTRYYIKEHNANNDSYIYAEQKIIDANDYASHFGGGSNASIKLYIKKYPNVQFYNQDKKQLSLLHCIFEKIPEWKIGHVDKSLYTLERTFDESRISVYDFLMNEVQEAFNCIVEWDTLTNTVNFYEEVEDGITEDNNIATQWDTDIFISKDNLANEINVSYSTDDIKTRLKISGGTEDLDIRDVNLGDDYIMNLDYYHNIEWMEQDVFDAYQRYLEAVKEYSPKYLEASKNRIAAYNKWNDLMNAVPAEGGVLLVGDAFEKLYCVYEPYNTAYVSTTISPVVGDTLSEIYSDKACTTKIEPEKDQNYVIQGYTYQYKSDANNYKCLGNSTDVNLAAFIEKLNLYHVNEDVKGNNSDNILLTLKNSNEDTVTIRIYDPHKPIGTYNPNIKYYCTKRTNEIYDRQNVTKDNFSEYEDLYTNNYMIQVIIVRSNSGLADTPQQYTLKQWVNGNLSASFMGLVDSTGQPHFKVQSIGTIGSYFCLAKSEISVEVLEDYGISLLRNKHKEYTQVFRTQTEAMFSYGGYQCVVQNEEPVGNIADGVRWLDTNSSPVELKQYNADKKEWVTIEEKVSEADRGNYENYQRYLDNYAKLVAVQNVLVSKERKSEYLLSGYKVENFYINLDNYTAGGDGVLRDSQGYTLEGNMRRAAAKHFDTNTDDISRMGMDQEFPLYSFKYSGTDYIVYLNGNVPYVSYPNSVAYYKTQMENFRQNTELRNFFNDDTWEAISPFIREEEYSNSNLILTGYESDEEQLSICEELLEDACKELKKLCQPSLEFSMTMANIYALPEFRSLISKFQLGNFVRVDIGNRHIKRARLLEIRLNFDDLSDLSCEFGNLVTTKDEIDKHADLMAQAVQAGKTVDKSSKSWQKTVKVANEIQQNITNGLQDAVLQIGQASGQHIQIDENGIWGRARKNTNLFAQPISDSGVLTIDDGTESSNTPTNIYVANTVQTNEEWEDEQFRIINNKFAFTNDNWKTAKSVFGKYTFGGEERWGLLAESVSSGLIESCEISGGTIKIGKQPDGTYAFEVAEDGTVTMGGGSKIGGVTIDDVNSALFNSTETVIHTTKPNKYKIGDLWILAYGETCGSFHSGNLLKAIDTPEEGEFNEAHWIDAIEDTTSIITNIRESFTWDDTGIQVAKRVTNTNGEVATPFYVQIASDRMGFHSQSTENGRTEDTEVVHIGNKSATIQNATLEGEESTIIKNELEVRDDANFYGAVNLYNESRTSGFMWQTEDNGSFSLVVL